MTRHDLTNKNAVKANSESSTKIQYKDNGITSFMNPFNFSDSFGPYILYNIIYSDLIIKSDFGHWRAFVIFAIFNLLGFE